MSATRRTVVIGFSQWATAALLVSGTRSAVRAAVTADDSDIGLLAGVAYDILPYPELPPELYIRAARQILDLKDTDVVAGLARLRATSHKAAWQDIPEARRVAILSAVQDTAFFRVLRANTVQVLLRDPAMFAIVGYGGPSIQYGGYLNRGFNDIGWLPAAVTQ